jgi:hypothetical protein
MWQAYYGNIHLVAGNIARAPITYEGIVHQARFVTVSVLIGRIAVSFRGHLI